MGAATEGATVAAREAAARVQAARVQAVVETEAARWGARAAAMVA